MPECAKVLQHAGYRGSDGAVTCCLCDHETEWRDCDQCAGDGFIELYEDDPINFGPEEVGPCPSCNGNGGDHVCTTTKCPTVTILSIFSEKPEPDGFCVWCNAAYYEGQPTYAHPVTREVHCSKACADEHDANL